MRQSNIYTNAIGVNFNVLNETYGQATFIGGCWFVLDALSEGHVISTKDGTY